MSPGPAPNHPLVASVGPSDRPCSVAGGQTGPEHAPAPVWAVPTADDAPEPVAPNPAAADAPALALLAPAAGEAGPPGPAWDDLVDRAAHYAVRARGDGLGKAGQQRLGLLRRARPRRRHAAHLQVRLGPL